MTQTTNTATAKKGLTTKHVILILGSLIIICAAIVVAIFLLKDKPEQSGISVINESNLEQIQGKVEENVAKGMFMTHMNTTWIFPDGKSSSSNAIMGNAAENNYPFWFTVTLPDTEEIIFQSGLMPVGTQLSKIKLDKNLKMGTYPAVITIHMIDDEGEEVEGNMTFNITLEVKN